MYDIPSVASSVLPGWRSAAEEVVGPINVGCGTRRVLHSSPYVGHARTYVRSPEYCGCIEERCPRDGVTCRYCLCRVGRKHGAIGIWNSNCSSCACSDA